jgi:hypothetical protein
MTPDQIIRETEKLYIQQRPEMADRNYRTHLSQRLKDQVVTELLLLSQMVRMQNI